MLTANPGKEEPAFLFADGGMVYGVSDSNAGIRVNIPMALPIK